MGLAAVKVSTTPQIRHDRGSNDERRNCRAHSRLASQRRPHTDITCGRTHGCATLDLLTGHLGVRSMARPGEELPSLLRGEGPPRRERPRRAGAH